MNEKQQQIRLAQRKIRWAVLGLLTITAIWTAMILYPRFSQVQPGEEKSIGPPVQAEWLPYTMIAISLFAFILVHLLRSNLPAFILNPRGVSRFLPTAMPITRGGRAGFPQAALYFSIYILCFTEMPIFYGLVLALLRFDFAYFIFFASLTVTGFILFLPNKKFLARLYDRIQEWSRGIHPE